MHTNISTNIPIDNEKITDSLNFLERERDILRLHDHPDRKFYIACEAQSSADYTISLREFTYDGVEYSEQLDTKKHKTKTDGRVKYLLPVFHLVLYHGWKRWLSKHSLQEMMDIPETLEAYRHKLPEYRLYVVDIHEQNPELFQTEWADVFRLMRHSRKKEELKHYVEEHMDEIRQLSKDTRMLLAVLLDQYKIMDDGRIEVKDMCEAWDGAMQMYAEEAYEKAYEEAYEEAYEKAYEKATKEATERTEKNTLERISRLMSLLKKENRLDVLENAFTTGGNISQLLEAHGI